MSNASINFRVNDTGVSSYMERMRQSASQMTANLIRDAQRQTDVAKDQLRLIQQQIALIERRSRLDREAAEQAVRSNRDQRISGIERRGQTIDNLADENKRRFNAGEISRDEFLQRRRRIEGLAQRNTVENISTQSDERLVEVREQARQSQLLANYMRENIDTIRLTSHEELLQMRRGDEALVDAVDESDEPANRLANQLASQQHIEEQAREGERDRDKRENPMLAMANGVMIDRIGAMVANIPQTRNELDYVKPMLALAGTLMGGLAGNLIDMVTGSKVLGTGIGQTQFGALGIQIGEKLGEFAGSAIERSFQSREELTTSNYALQALIGKDLGMAGFRVGDGSTGTISKYDQDYSRYGLDYKETSRLMYETASRKGSSSQLGRDSENIVAMQQGWGVKQDTSMSMLELVRSNRDGDKNLVNIIGGVLQKGQGTIFKDGDRAFLNEFLMRNYSQLQKTLLSTQSRVSSGTTMDILGRFNSIGGEFSAQDSRSTGLINQIQGSLANPNSDNMKALAFTVMRRKNPKMGIAGLLEEQQKGLASPTYLKSMLGSIDEMGGDRDMRIMNVAGMFGLQDNMAAARRIYDNRGKLMSGQISLAELKGTGAYSQDSVRQLGEEQTGKYTKSTAEIENAFIDSAVKGVTVVGEKMADLMGDMMDGMKRYVKAKFDEMMQEIKGGKENTTKPRAEIFKTPKSRAEAAKNGLNSDGSLRMNSVANKF